MRTERPWIPTDKFWDRLGTGLMVFLICIGIGGCIFVADLHHVSGP